MPSGSLGSENGSGRYAIYQKRSLVVTVEDNGTGIKQSKMEGIGLRSIRLRAAYINATLKIESDDKGTPKRRSFFEEA